jgi:hypothetical protein
LASPNPTIRHLSARNAALIRHGGDNAAVAADLAGARLAESVREVIDSGVVITPEWRDRIAALLWSESHPPGERAVRSASVAASPNSPPGPSAARGSDGTGSGDAHSRSDGWAA